MKKEEKKKIMMESVKRIEKRSKRSTEGMKGERYKGERNIEKEKKLSIIRAKIEEKKRERQMERRASMRIVRKRRNKIKVDDIFDRIEMKYIMEEKA